MPWFQRCLVYFVVCQNCIELDAATISGIVVADIVATIFLAIAVYCITGQERGHLSRGEERGAFVLQGASGLLEAPGRKLLFWGPPGDFPPSPAVLG